MKLQPKLGSQKTLQENLHRIWQKKKVEFNLNQKEAADLLGWTAGALSQYLNGVTKLKPEAVIKLSNFLGVDPTELDPQMIHFMPDVKVISVEYNFSNSETKLSKNASETWSFNINRFLIRLDTDAHWKQNNKKYSFPAGSYLVVSKDPRLSLVKENSIWAVVLKAETKFQIIPNIDLPMKKDMAKQYLIHGLKIE